MEGYTLSSKKIKTVDDIENNDDEFDEDDEDFFDEEVQDYKYKFMKDTMYTDGEHLPFIVDLSPRQVNSMPLAETLEEEICDEYPCISPDDLKVKVLTRRLKKHTVSLKRKGREEGIKPWVESMYRGGVDALRRAGFRV